MTVLSHVLCRADFYGLAVAPVVSSQARARAFLGFCFSVAGCLQVSA